MDPTTPKRQTSLTDDQEQSRTEWRHLCETLERAQGEELARECLDKYSYVKTYQMYGKGIERRIAEIQKAAAQGNYLFFEERGVPTNVLNPTFVNRLLDDWKAAIEAKKRQVAEVFNLRFHDDINHCIDTFEEAQSLNVAVPIHQCDGLIQLCGMAKPNISGEDVDQLRLEIAQLREQLENLAQLVHSHLGSKHGNK